MDDAVQDLPIEFRAFRQAFAGSGEMTQISTHVSADEAVVAADASFVKNRAFLHTVEEVDTNFGSAMEIYRATPAGD